MKVVFLLAAVVVAAVFAVPTYKEPGTHAVHASQDFLVKQKNVLRLFWRVQEPNVYQDQYDFGKTYKFEDDIESYRNKEAVKEFLIQYKQGFLPRGDIFSVYYEPHRYQMIKLFEVFYYAKDFDTLYKAACWARDRVNEYMFVYSFSVALYHRQDTRDIFVPPFYELFPQKFVDSEVIYKAQKEYVKYYGKQDQTVYIPVTNYTEFWYKHDVEERVAYFGEDIGINMHNKFVHMKYPFWMDAQKYGISFERKGEFYYYTYQQLLARYESERLANYLPESEPFNFFNPVVKHGYAPKISYMNGVDFPLRPDDIHLQDLEDFSVYDLQVYLQRVYDAIDQGYFYDREGNKFSLKDFKGIDFIGKMIEGFSDLPTEYYGRLTYYAYYLVSHVVDPLHTLGSAPGVLEHYETATRDPAFYSLRKSFQKLYNKYKEHLTPYKREELIFSGVKVENVEVDKLITYFDDFEFDLYSIFSGPYESDKNMNIRYQVPRLNHKTFTYKFEVSSDRDTDAVVRVFLGPKYNLYGHEYTQEERRQHMIEMDKFVYHLKSGKNSFVRSSDEAFYTTKDYVPTKELFKRVEDAVQGKGYFDIEETFDCGFPERLLLPRGRKGGMPFTLFVMVTPFEGDKTTYNLGYCDSYYSSYPENKAMGYPFDRKISEYDFNTPNMYFKDVIIFHKTKEELNKTYN